MAKNPYMKVFVASGYYDMATPYFATEYTLSHLELHPSLRGNISTGEYEAGPHDVHSEEISREAEGRCDGFHRGSQREPPAGYD